MEMKKLDFAETLKDSIEIGVKNEIGRASCRERV